MEPLEKIDPVWKLLSKAKKTEPSPFFARNVIRELRLRESSRSRLGERLSQFFSSRAFIGAAGCAALAVTLIVLTESPELTMEKSAISHVPLLGGASESFDPATELASIEYLGQLMAVADPGQLNEAALADLFY